MLSSSNSSVAVADDARAQSRQEPKATPSLLVEVPSYFDRRTLWMRSLAFVLLIILSPVILMCMLLVRLSSRGPALFRQTRLGRNGTPFQVLKIRTMYQNAEESSGPTLCQPGDSRITPLGKLLRTLHLDELPQLVNVVRGEMCLIGPRPERPEIIVQNKLIERVPGFAERLKVLPGVTGLAQINLPADISPDCVLPKVQLDLEYIATANANLDMRILLCTTLRMVGLRYGLGVRLLRVNRKVDLDTNCSPPACFQRGSERMEREPARPIGVTSVSHQSVSSNGSRNSRIDFPASFVELGNDNSLGEAEEASELAPVPHRPR